MRAFTLLALLFVIGTLPAFADIVNGGFEDPNIGVFYRTVYGGDSTGIPGWLVTGDSVDIVNTVEGPSWAHTGRQAIDLAGTPGPGGVEQSIDTILGTYYTFSFWASSNGGPYPGGLLVGWNGVTIDTVDTPAQGTWERHAYTVVGTGGPTLFSLSTPISTNQGPLVDDVNVHVPEPGSLWGLGAGLALFLGLVLRPRSA
jgi:hypothetical protein